MQRTIKIFLFIGFGFMYCNICGQNLVHPEAIVHFEKTDDYFISDAASGIIYIKTLLGIRPFTAPETGSHGLAIKDEYLLACFENRINIIDLVSGELNFSYKIPEANFLKNICMVNDIAYVTDFTRRKIFRIDFSKTLDPKSELFCITEGIPSGISYIHEIDALIYSTWGKRSRIISVNRKDRQSKTLNITNLLNLNGIIYQPGLGYFGSSWLPQGVWWFKNNIDDPELISEEVLKPAGMDFNSNNLLTVLNAGAGTITEIDMFNKRLPDYTEIKITAFPNPVVVNSLITYELIEEMDLRIWVYDCQGRLVEKVFSGSKNEGMHTLLFEPSDLPNGIYYVDFQSDRWKKAIPITVVH